MADSEQTKTFRRDGKIIIEIPEDILIDAVEGNPDSDFGMKVRDEDEYLDYVCANLVNELGYDADTGIGSFYRLLDEMTIDAAENDAGIDIEEDPE